MLSSITILQNGLFNWQKQNNISVEELNTGIRHDIREPGRLLYMKDIYRDYEIVKNSLNGVDLPLKQNELNISTIKENTENIKNLYIKLENPVLSDSEKNIINKEIDSLNTLNEELFSELVVVEPLYDRGKYKEIGKPDFEYKDITNLDEANSMFDEYNAYHSKLGTDMKFIDNSKDYVDKKMKIYKDEIIGIEEVDMIQVMTDLMRQQQQYEAIAQTIKIVHELRLTNFL